jgi:hypothetical protein
MIIYLDGDHTKILIFGKHRMIRQLIILGLKYNIPKRTNDLRLNEVGLGSPAVK